MFLESINVLSPIHFLHLATLICLHHQRMSLLGDKLGDGFLGLLDHATQESIVLTPLLTPPPCRT